MRGSSLERGLDAIVGVEGGGGGEGRRHGAADKRYMLYPNPGLRDWLSFWLGNHLPIPKAKLSTVSDPICFKRIKFLPFQNNALDINYTTVQNPPDTL